MLGCLMIGQSRSQKHKSQNVPPKQTHFHPRLFIVFLQGSKIFSSFGELAFFHAFTHIMMHEGTLRIPCQILVLIGDTGPKNHNAMTRCCLVFWHQSKEPIRQKCSASRKNLGAARRPARDSSHLHMKGSFAPVPSGMRSVLSACKSSPHKNKTWRRTASSASCFCPLWWKW